MKSLIFVVGLISALLLNANCQSLLGNWSQIRVRSNQSDPDSCRIYLDSDVDYTSNVTNEYTNISQSFIPSTPSTSMPDGCSFLDLNFTSFFNGDASRKVIPYTRPVHYNYDSDGNLMSSWVNTTITAANLTAMNGTECLYLRENQTAYDQYLCLINYGGTPIYWVAYGSGSGSNFSFASFSGGRSMWVLSSNYIVQAEQYDAIVDLNTSFPKVVADIYSSCGSNNKNFHMLNVQITVTASVDLASLLGSNFGHNISQAYVIVKKKSTTTPGKYIVVETPMNAIRSGSFCWTLGVTWDKVLPDMNYCANGCRVTFVFAKTPYEIYVLKTTGIKTTKSIRR